MVGQMHFSPPALSQQWAQLFC